VGQLHRALYRIDHLSEREKRAMTWLTDLRHDLRFSFRRVRHRPLLFTLILLTLALGTGTVMTFFGAADIILLRPLPIAEPDRVMTIWRNSVSAPEVRTGLAAGTIMDLREETRTFASLTAAEPYAHDVTAEGVAVSIGAWRVIDGFFEVLASRPALGRLLQSADYVPGNPQVVVVSHDFWRSHLGGDSAVVGRTTHLDGNPVVVVGVLPPEFPYAEGRQLYVPAVFGDGQRQNRVADYILTYGRLAPGSSEDAARSELHNLVTRSDARITSTQTPREIQVVPLDDALLGSVRSGLGLLALGAILLLVMTAASAAGLMVADTLDRHQELTVRASLGAGRGRMIRQLMAEAGVLSLAAGVLGFGLGLVGLRAFQRWAPIDMPRLAEIQVDPRLAMIGAATVLLLGLFVGLFPARLVATTDLQSALKEGGTFGAGRGGRLARRMLVGTQVALASMLLCAGGLLVRSWMTLRAEDQGYQAAGVLGHEAHVWSYFPTPAARIAFADQATARLRAVPGVQSAAILSSLPLAQDVGNDQANVSRPGEGQNLTFYAVVGTPELFPTLGVSVVEGRGFHPDDRADGERVVVVSRSAATTLFPGQDPVGRLIEVGYSGPPLPRRIIGVAGDARYISTTEPGRPTVYIPHAQAPTGSFYLVTQHATVTPGGIQAVQQALRELVPGASLAEPVSLEALEYAAGGPRRFAVLLLTSFAVIALSLTAVGLFGLLAQGVRARRQELGIRMAVGAWPTTLRNMVLGEGLRLAGAGLLAGIGLLLLASSVLRRVLYGVPVHDPLTLAGVVILVMAVAALASWWPALQATRVDPIQALRRER
jgi:predicted permease